MIACLNLPGYHTYQAIILTVGRNDSWYFMQQVVTYSRLPAVTNSSALVD